MVWRPQDDRTHILFVGDYALNTYDNIGTMIH